MLQAKKKKGIFQIFTNKAFVGDQNQEPTASSYKNTGFLHRRASNPENDPHKALDSMVHEINDATLKRKNQKNIVHVIPEDLKGKRYKDLTPKEIQELGEINASQDRFRYRFHEHDYKNDVDRVASANIRWLD